MHIVAEALDASDTMIAVLKAAEDVPGGLRFMNASAALATAIGREPGQPIALPLGDIAAPEATATLDAIATEVRLGNPWRGDLACLSQTAQRIWLGCHLMPAHADRQAAQLYVLIGRDITARRAETQAARVLNNLLAKAFLVADVPLAIVNASGRFVMTNQSMERQLGCRAASPAGKRAIDFLAPDSRPILLAARERQDADGAPFRSDVELLHADGKSVPVLLSSTIFEGLDRHRFTVMTTLARDCALLAEAPGGAAVPADAPTRYQVAGQLRFIDLEVVREAIGDRWEFFGKRAMDAAEQIIRKRISLEDTVNRDQDRGFIICFASGTEEQATQRATAIARETRLHLISLGEDENAVAMQVAIARVPVSAGSPAEDQIAHHLHDVADAGLRAAQAPLAPPRISRVLRTMSGTPMAVYVSPAPRPSAPGSIVLPASTVNQDLAPILWAAALDTAKPLHTLLLDVSFELFVRRDRTEALLAACAKLPQATRPHLNILLTGIPVGVTTSLMQDISRRLKPFCAGVGWHLDEWSAPPFDLRACPLAWAVIDLSTWAGPPAAPPERLKRVSGVLAAYGTKTLATHVGSMEALKELHTAGIHCGTLADGAGT